MENKKKTKQNNWKFAVGIAIGIIIYRVFVDYIWPMIAQ